MPESGKVKARQPASVVAMNKIKELIFTGELTADSNHLESELAERLGMSRTPIREATIMLEAHGLLEVQPRKGIRIKAISVQDMADIYEILTELESLAAKRAAARKPSKTELQGLLDAIDEMDTALAAEDREAWAKADEDFHRELVRLGGNRHIVDMVKVVTDQVRRARSITLHMRPLPTKSNKDHRQLCTAILKGNGDKAQEIHRRHRQNASELLISLLNNSGLKRV